MKAVVMAGGEGTRLRPLTCNLPKPMVPVMDKPVMEYAIELLKKHNIKDIAVTLQYLPQNIKDYFGDGSEWGVNLGYYVEDTPLGTAGSVKNAQNFLDEPFIVISGDALTDFNLQQAIDFHDQKQALATIVLTRVKSPLEYGLVLTEESGLISRFLEKPSWGEVFSDTVNTGIYVLNPELLDLIPENSIYDFSRDLFPRLLKDKKGLYGCVLEGYWCDIGSCEQYHQVHLDILDGKVGIAIDACRDGQSWLGEGARISPEATLTGPVYIGPGCEIESGACLEAYTVLGEGSLVKSGASLKRTITWKGCYIGQDAQLRGAVIGKGVTIERKAGVFEGAVIGDDSTIESEAVIKPRVKIWPNKYIEESRVISQSVVWSPRAEKALFKRGGIKGGFNRELTPEKCARIGRAIGTFLPVSARMAIGYDFSPLSLAIRDSITGGLLSSGIQVLDTGRLILPAFRYATANLRVKCGVYIRLLDAVDELANIIVVGNNGADLPKGDERKVENLFYREEFRQIQAGDICEPLSTTEVNSMYLLSLVSHVDTDMVKRRRFNLVIAAKEQRLSDHLAVLLDDLGCRVTRLDSWSRRDRTNDYMVGDDEAIKAISGLLKSRETGLGMYLYDSGQKLALVDRRGRVVRDEEYMALLSVMFSNHFETLFMPVTIPRAVEDMARGAGKRVIRTKTGMNDFMEQMINGGEEEQFRLHADGLYTAVKILEYLALKDTDFADVLDGVPAFYYQKREVAVPWEFKGRVIRRLAEDGGRQARQESLEGVRLENSGGWSLVLPDEERPVCRIYSEGFSQEAAEALTDFYEERIRQVCQEED